MSLLEKTEIAYSSVTKKLRGNRYKIGKLEKPEQLYIASDWCSILSGDAKNTCIYGNKCNGGQCKLKKIVMDFFLNTEYKLLKKNKIR